MRQHVHHVLQTQHLPLVQADQDVATLDAGAGRRATRLDALDDQFALDDLAVVGGDTVAAEDAVAHAGPTADADHVGGHTHHGVDRNGEADALGPGTNGDVDADQLALDV